MKTNMLNRFPHQPFGDGFKADNDTQAGFFELFAEFATAEPPLSGEQLLDGIREVMWASHLVHPDIAKKLPIYRKVIAFLESYNISVPITRESGRLPARRLICRIWNSAEYARDRSLAFRIYDNIRKGYYTGSSSPSGHASVEQDVFRSPRCDSGHDMKNKYYRSSWTTSRSLAKSIADRFDSEALRTGNQAEERWDHYLKNYASATLERELGNELKTKSSQHVLREYAVDFYRDFNHGKANSWGEVLRMVDDEVNANNGNGPTDGRLHRKHGNE